MGTTDGVNTADWDIVHDYAVEIVNAREEDRPALLTKLHGYLQTLEEKYGPLPSILATRADYLDINDPQREQLLLQAHTLAESQGDIANVVHTAHSLAELCLERKDLKHADHWITTFHRHLSRHDDSTYRDEYHRLRREYRRQAISDVGD